MTKKDYVRLAAALKDARIRHPAMNLNAAHDVVADCVAIALAADSGTFNRLRFLTACGVGT